MYVKHFEGLFGTDALAEMVAASWWLLNTQMQGTSSETILCVKKDKILQGTCVHVYMCSHQALIAMTDTFTFLYSI